MTVAAQRSDLRVGLADAVTRPTLAVVLIGRNEASNLPRLMESVLRETVSLESAEIVVVDSASEDGMSDVAARYPVSVLRMRRGQRLTAAAARLVGYRATTAEYVLFLDGDMVLNAGWLSDALDLVSIDPAIAVVTGDIVDVPPGADRTPSLSPLPRRRHPVDVPYSGGAALHRRSVLEEVGSFNPYLYSDEEPELCIRIRHAGYRVVNLGRPIAYHVSDPMTALRTMVGRRRRGLYLGAGQAIRYHLGRPLLWPYVRERGYGLGPGAALSVGIAASLRSRTSGDPRWTRVWLAAMATFIALDAIRKRSLYATICSMVQRLLILDGTIRGFLRTPLDPGSYPGVHDVVRDP